MKARNILIFGLAVLAGLTAVFLLVGPSRPYTFQGSLIDPAVEAPAFELTDVEGNPFNLSDLDGQVVDGGVAIFQTTYSHTVYAQPPDDGKLRELNSEYFWLTVKSQHLMPRPEAWEKSPLPYSKIYAVS